MAFKVLIMGLSGAGKTTLANKIAAQLPSVTRLNADEVRRITKNWDFSDKGRIAQSHEMRNRADRATKKVVVCDFIAPTPALRDIFNADYTVWVNTIKECQYEDTTALFQPNHTADYIITDHNDDDVKTIVDKIKAIVQSLK